MLTCRNLEEKTLGVTGYLNETGRGKRDKKRTRKIDVKAETGKGHQGEEGILVI
jgi:hypothetical protein